MIADSVIDDSAAALVGRLKAEARESKAAREDFFFLPSFLHDNQKAAIWQRALLRDIFRGGVFFSVRFFLQCLHMRMRYRDSVRKAKAAGGKEKPDSMLRVCNFCMQLFFFFSSVFSHPSLDHLGTELINTGWLLCLCSVRTVSGSSEQASAASEQAMLTLRWRVMFAVQLETSLFSDKAATFVNVWLRALVIISMSKSANTTSSKYKWI